MNFARKSSFHVFALKLPTVMSLCYEEREHDFFSDLRYSHSEFNSGSEKFSNIL